MTGVSVGNFVVTGIGVDVIGDCVVVMTGVSVGNFVVTGVIGNCVVPGVSVVVLFVLLLSIGIIELLNFGIVNTSTNATIAIKIKHPITIFIFIYYLIK